MRLISFALLGGGLIAVFAGLYYDRTSGQSTGAVLASAETAVPTATAAATRVVSVTATMVAPPASALDPTPTLTPAPVAAIETAPTPAEQAPTSVAVQSIRPAAPSPTQSAPAAAATATPRPPTPVPPPPPTSTPVPPPPPAAPVSLGGLEQQMFSAHNVERANNGVAALQIDGTLTQLARQRAQDMASKGYFSHTSPTGQTAFSLLNASGYVYTLAGENLARNNYPDSQSVSVAMSGFMASPTHRVNVLETKFSRVGIGMAVGADGLKYFAVIFAAK